MKAGDIALRPARIEDAAFVADLYTALFPDDPIDPVMYEHNWRSPDSNVRRERFIGELAGAPVAFAEHRHVRWEEMPERYGNVSGDILPEHRSRERLDALVAAMEERSRGEGTRRLTAWAWKHDALRIGVLKARGFREERRERFWELNLRANRAKLEAMATASREKMREQAIRVLTIDRDVDPDKWRQLWRMSNEAEQDVPTTEPHVEFPFDDFMSWMRSPGLREDRVWIARRDGDILGVSMLSYPPKRGVVMTDWTGVARAGRGKGVARALKCETVMQAIALGVDRVRTDNDSRNTPILHINETMGYRIRAEMIQFLKDA